MSATQELTPPTTPRKALKSVGDVTAVSTSCTVLGQICQGELDLYVLDDVLVVLSTFDERYPIITCKATNLVRKAVDLVKYNLQDTIDLQPGETCVEDNTETIPPLFLEDLTTFELAKEVASWSDTNRNPMLEWGDLKVQSTLEKLTHAVKTYSPYSPGCSHDSDGLERVHSLFRDTLISYHELLESIKPPEFTTLPNLVYQHNREVSVALVAQAIDGLTHTYGTRFPEDAEPLRADFTAWLAFIGLELEKHKLNNGEDDEYKDEQNGEKDDERSDRSGRESLATANGKKELIVATPFSEWLATRQVTANAKGLDKVTAKFTKRCYGEIGSNLGLLLAQKMVYDQAAGTIAAYNKIPTMMVGFERTMGEIFFGKEDESVAFITAYLEGAGLKEEPEVFRKPNPAKVQPVHTNANPLKA